MAETYKYRARDSRGKLLSGTLVADSKDLVLARLREMGHLPLAVERHKEGMKKEINFSNKVKLKDLALFSRQFSTMINSGLPILKAMAILEQQTSSKQLAKVVGEVRLDIERGSSLSGALGKHPKAFNNLFVAMVKAGEAGGVLENVLDRLAMNLEREMSLRHKIKSAMTYPVVVLGFVSLIMMAMLIFIVPQFKSIYATLNGTLPLPTRILMTISNALKHDFILVVAAMIGGAVGFRKYIKTKGGRDRWDRLKLKIPVFGSLVQKTALARFSRILSVLNKSGVPILQSLDVVSETVNNTLMAKAIADVQSAVKEGESLAKPLARHPVFPPMVVQMLAVGEETGSLDTMLEKVAIFYDEEVTAAVDALTSMIEPIMIFFVGGAVGMSVIALYLPMFNIINLVK